MILRGLLALACAGAVGVATAAVPAGPQILTEDVSRFYALYDSAGGKPSVAQLRGYLAEVRPAWPNWPRRAGSLPNALPSPSPASPSCMHRDETAWPNCPR